ncbi:hypothetical protein FACS189454_08140 [Planctomycetales bacterium]|nr:hypothetical protein FACS189454_08140 [Planctomycetales bacterium]
MFFLFALASAANADSPLLEEVKKNFGDPLPPKIAVTRVIDGDTIEVAGGITVRLLGIDTPEAAKGKLPAQPFAGDAKRFVENAIIGSGNKVTLYKDAAMQVGKFGRDLAWVIVDTPDGEKVLQELLLEEGLAKVWLQYAPPLKLHYLLEAENKAQIFEEKKKRGKNIWENFPEPAGKTVWIAPHSTKYHTEKCGKAKIGNLKGIPVGIPPEQAEAHGLTPCNVCKP